MLLIAGVGIGYGMNTFLSERRQADVAARGAEVMPFDLNTTTHTFERVADGGVQTVTADDPTDVEQIALIRTHLQEETTRFRQGDFSDPAQIHGEDMPGLADLQAGADRIAVEYHELPDGARMSYRTGIHRNSSRAHLPRVHLPAPAAHRFQAIDGSHIRVGLGERIIWHIVQGEHAPSIFHSTRSSLMAHAPAVSPSHRWCTQLKMPHLDRQEGR